MSKKVEKEQAKEQKRLAILLRTMVNGYMLEVNNEGYMYFNAQSLLEGFMVHIGLERLESMTKEEIKDMRDQGYAELAEGWQCREETPGRGDRTESLGGRPEEAD